MFLEINNAVRGEAGEKGVFAELDKILDKNLYTIHKNFKIPGRVFDIDAIVVGPKGIIVLEVKNLANQMVFIGNNAFFQIDNELKRVSSRIDPRNEASWHADELARYLNANHFDKLPINKAVIFFKKYAAMIEKGTRVGIYLISGVEELNKYITGLADDPRFTPDLCARLNAFLSNF